MTNQINVTIQQCVPYQMILDMFVLPTKAKLGKNVQTIIDLRWCDFDLLHPRSYRIRST